MRMHSPEWLREARRLTREHDVLLIVDEVFTGYGRTGRFWASEHAGVVPDILCSAKGLSGGLLPFAATITTAEVFRGFFGESDRAFLYGHTYCGNPLGARVAAEVLSVYWEESVVEGVAPRAALLAETFQRLGELPGVHRARTLGLCGALDLGDSVDYHEKAGWKVSALARERGLLLRPLGNVVYTVPPLNIPLSDLEELLATLSECVRKVVGAD